MDKMLFFYFFALIPHYAYATKTLIRSVEPLVRIDTQKLDEARAHTIKETAIVRSSMASIYLQQSQMRTSRQEIIWLLKRYFGYSYGI